MGLSENMDGAVVRDFFEGKASAAELASTLSGAFIRRGEGSHQLQMRDIDTDFAVTSKHLIAVCDAVLSGIVPAEGLRALGFGLLASDHFDWDADDPNEPYLAETIHDWSSPEVNYVLTVATAAKFRERLLTGTSTFGPEDYGEMGETWRSAPR